MYLRKGKLPGVKELTNVGYANDGYYGYGYYRRKPRTMQQRYDKAMADPKCGMVVASLTVNQTAGIECLLKNGFKKVGPSRVNPNSGNSILLLAKRITKKKKAK